MMEPKGLKPDNKTCRTKLYYFLQTLWWSLPLLRPLLSKSISMPSHNQRMSAAKGCNLVSVLLVDTLLVYFVQLCLILLITLSLFWTTPKEQQLVMWVSTRSYLCNFFALCFLQVYLMWWCYLLFYAGCCEVWCGWSLHQRSPSPYCYDWNTYRSPVGNIWCFQSLCGAVSFYKC